MAGAAGLVGLVIGALVLSVLACSWAATQIALVTWISVALWILLALALYFGYARSHSVLAPAPQERP